MAKKGNLQLDLSGVSTQSERVVLPTGNYPVRITSAEVAETSKGGHMIVMNFEVMSGNNKGAVVVNRYNIVNDNEDAVRIGLSQLKTILKAGKFKNPDLLSDTSDLIGLELTIYLEEEDHTFTNKEGEEIETTQNSFKGYFELKEVDEEEEEEEAPAPKKKAPVKKKAPAKKKAEPEQEEEEEEDSQPAFPWQK